MNYTFEMEGHFIINADSLDEATYKAWEFAKATLGHNADAFTIYTYGEDGVREYV